MLNLGSLRLTKRKKDVLKLTLSLALLALLPVSLPSEGNSAFAHQVGTEAKPHMSPWKIESSIKIPMETLSQAMRQARDAYSKVIAPYAKINLDQASAIAKKADPNALLMDIGLQTIRQNLVYIAILSKESSRQMVVIDAGNGRVLSTRTIHPRHHSHKQVQGNVYFPFAKD